MLRWHRKVFKLTWWLKSKPKNSKPRNKTTVETSKLIRRMAKENRLWGAERIRGELLKLGIHVAKRTIQKYMRQARKGTSPGGQEWSTFFKEHGHEIWACDFVQTYDALFRQIFAFVIVKHDTQKVVHQAVTYHPTQEWNAQQLRNATFDDAPRFIIRDDDGKFGSRFDDVAEGDDVAQQGVSGMPSVPGNELRARYPIPANDSGRLVGEPVLGGLKHDYRLAA